MADLTGQQLKDSYQNLVTIDATIESNPTSGQLENGLGNAITALGIGTNTPTDVLNISSASNQIGLDTGDQATYGTLDVGHFTNGAFIGTQAGSNTVSDLLRLGTSGTERMKVHSSGDISFRDGSNSEAFYWDASAGSLGIGTTSPVANLHIKDGSSSSDVRIQDSTETTTLYLQAQNGLGVVGTLTNHDLRFDVNDNEKMRIDSSGNITHSGTSPQYIFKTASNTNFQIAVQENVANALEITPSTTAGGTTFSNPALVVNSSGNVGIGTISPNALNAKFTVKQSADTSKYHGVSIEANGTDEYLGIGYDGTSFTLSPSYLSAGAFKPLQFHTSNNPRLTIDTSGNVGIGTASVPFQASSRIVHFVNGTDSAISGIQYGGSNNYYMQVNSSAAYLWNAANSPLVFASNNTERMRILPTGGITFNGDTATANALDDYEEGTFDATIYEVGGSDIVEPTANYVKIGSLVHIQVQAFGGTTGGAGVVRMNLPFNSASMGGANIPAYSVSNGNIVSLFCLDGTDYVEFVDTIGAIATGNKSIGSDWSSASRLYFNFTYSTT